MASATYLQSLNDSTNQSGVTASDRRQIETFLASEAIPVRAAVSFDMSKTANSDKTLYVVKTSTGTQADKCFVGIATTTAAAAGDRIEVCIAGICEANTAATATGVTQMISGVEGRIIDYVSGSVLQKVAVACEAHTANVATVIVLNQF